MQGIKKLLLLVTLLSGTAIAADTPISCQGASCKVVVKTRNGSNAAQTAVQFQAPLGTGVVKTDSSGNATAATIVNADVDASAAIAGSKLQAAGTSNAGAVTTATQSFSGLKAFSDGVSTPQTFAVSGAGVGTGITFFRSSGHYLNLYGQSASNGSTCDAACAGSSPAGICIGAANTTAGVTCSNNSSSRACLCVTFASSP